MKIPPPSYLLLSKEGGRVTAKRRDCSNGVQHAAKGRDLSLARGGEERPCDTRARSEGRRAEADAFLIADQLRSGYLPPLLLRRLLRRPPSRVSFLCFISQSFRYRCPHRFLGHCSADLKTLNVGIELKAETLPLRSGRRTYELLGLRRSSSYEVKISYPASIPAKFSIQLQRPRLELRSTKNRRLLDTEKLIFKADQEESVFVSLTVENGGVIAMKSVPEQELVIYNIVCLSCFAEDNIH
ncbi:hypothetical protein ZIOFF_014766 [Zingiber officinale]|uniref:Uncharacterized protein n=1 Tax=Zingiber officinale TaxID=94328 RepID=A0A8J5LLX1_ZINOF|nr:hypothetical protein ZIOFF_014766 [Zingiber officinale]